ncbi:MAG: hypothetical protein IPM74_11670 [Crocinitomicaceae bacterium]|nr:hypothetical protein [Crocinitomicaceae bacterium]
MKNLLTAITLWSFCHLSNAQSDTLFPNISAKWIVGASSWDGSGSISSFYKCTMLNDTIDTLGFFWHSMTDQFGIDRGCVRADSGKVYYLGYSNFSFGTGGGFMSSIPYLMYDFTLNAGDTAYFDSSIPQIIDISKPCRPCFKQTDGQPLN